MNCATGRRSEIFTTIFPRQRLTQKPFKLVIQWTQCRVRIWNITITAHYKRKWLKQTKQNGTKKTRHCGGRTFSTPQQENLLLGVKTTSLVIGWSSVSAKKNTSCQNRILFNSWLCSYGIVIVFWSLGGLITHGRCRLSCL